MRSGTAAGAALLLAVLATAGCGDGEGDDRGLTVLAAASLTDAFEELADRFETEHRVEVTFSFGSSTDLAGQALDGAPGDVLATADEPSMAVATRAGVVGEAHAFATNVLVVVTPPDDPAGVADLHDLAGTTWVRCADEAPCGRAAVRLLEEQGVTAAPASLEEDARSTLEKVASGEADAGLVYATDAAAESDSVATVPIAAAEDLPNRYLVGVLEQAEEPDLAAAWTDLVRSPEGRAVLGEHGFGAP